MSCACHCQATAEHFGPKAATDDLARYHAKGPDATTAAMLEGLRSTSRRFASLLDIGAGIGVLHHELLGSSVDRAVHVEASPAYIEVARGEDSRRGHDGRVDYVLGDATEVADELQSADIVALDRAICCYPDWERLLRISASKTSRIYAFSIPRDRWYVRLGVRVNNLLRRIRSDAFWAYVHPVTEVEGVLAEMGFRRTFLRRTLVWHIALFELTDTSASVAAA